MKSRGNKPPQSKEGMRSGGLTGGRRSRGPGVSSLNSGQYKQGNNNSSVSGAGFKAAAAVYGKQPMLSGNSGGLNSNNVFNIPKYGGGGLGGGIGGSGIGGSGIGGSGIGSNPYSLGGIGSGSGIGGGMGNSGNTGNEGKDSALGGRYNF